MRYDLGSTMSMKIDVQQRICSHMNYISSSPDLQRAMIYLKLIEEGCDEKAAMQFASKNVCMSDATLEWDGPANFRKLKVKHHQNAITLKGWINMGLEYELGRGFSNLSKDVVARADIGLRKTNTNMTKEEKQRTDFISKMNRMNEFLDKTYNQYSFDIKERDQLLSKVSSGSTDRNCAQLFEELPARKRRT